MLQNPLCDILTMTFEHAQVFCPCNGQLCSNAS